MISIKKKFGIFILIFLTINSIISPVYLIKTSPSYNSKSLKSLNFPLDNNIQGFVNVKESNNIGLFDNILIDDLLYLDNNPKIKVIVLFKDGTLKSSRVVLIDSIFENYKIIYNYDIIPATYLECNRDELINKKKTLSQVTQVEKIFKSKVYNLPYIDDALPTSSSLNKDSYPNWWVSAVGANNLPYNGTGIRVAVIDTGIYEHPDLTIGSARNFVSDEYSFEYEDDVGHGTHVAGIIGGNGSSSDGLYRGIAPGVTLINARAGGISGLDEGDVINAIEWSVNTASADIISMSFGDINPLANNPMTIALSAATDSGVICISSAGNSGPGYISGGSPASGIDVISVGATDSNNNLASFSSWGPTYTYLSYPDVVAPGVHIISTESPDSIISDEKRLVGDYFDFALDGDYIPLSGTSMACPMVAGALAILKQAYPSITPEAARIALLKGATELTEEEESQALRSGYGLINVSQSLEFLDLINNTHININDLALVAPKKLPVAPFDLLNFPGDNQLFNLTIISGDNNSYDINIPSSPNGLTMAIDKSQLIFDKAGTEFIGLNIKIDHDAQPGLRTFKINITSGSDLYDEINISINVKFPDARILLESFHGLNDWDPLFSVYQMSFYDWMKDIYQNDIAVDYQAEYWSPNYDKLLNNSILTKEKLAQYDLIVLQNPILPYTPLEISNLKGYFDSGGNILFLGTRYQDMCIDNINSLFTSLDVDIQLNNENLIDEIWEGTGASVNPQFITELNESIIFNNVTNFLWKYGSKLTISGDAKTIASENGDTLAATYDGASFGKGKFVIFGDLYWTSIGYKSFGQYANHRNLLNNLIEYFFSSNNVSLNILLDSPNSGNSNINLSIYAKNRSLDSLIDSTTLNTYLNVSIKNDGFYEEILTFSPYNGYANNYTYSLPFPNSNPYEINANITIDSHVFIKSSKYLYFDDSEIPKITNVTSNKFIVRNGTDSLYIDVFLDAINYNCTTYLSIYPSSYYSKTETINKTFELNNSPLNLFKYSVNYTALQSDPAGLGIFFITPQNPSSNYINPNTPRLSALFVNNPPQFNEDSSTITIDNNQVLVLSDTYEDDSLNVFSVSQGSILNLKINVSDSVDYEDQDSSNMNVSVNFFIASITQSNSLIPIDPTTNIYSLLTYDGNSNIQRGTFTIPFEMSFSSITGFKSISTVSTYNNLAQDGYIGLIWITVYDSEGESEYFIVVFLIQEGFTFDLILAIVIIGVIIIAGIGIIIFAHVRKKKRSKFPTIPTYYLQEESQYSSKESPHANVYYCPFCGQRLSGLRNFCPTCGKSLNIEE